MNQQLNPREAEPQEWWWVVECSDYIRKQHPGTPRYAVIPISRPNQYRNILCRVRYSTEAAANAAAIAAEGENEIRNFWSLGLKTVWSGMSRPDAVREAARRSSLPQLWCVLPNEDAQTNSHEPYTVKPFDGSLHSEKDKVLATCESERAAWQAIPGIVEEDRQRAAAYEQQRQELANTARRNKGIHQVLRLAAMVALVAGAIWLLVTVVHWFWVHPLF